jgi:hypothetical protein
VRHFKLGLYNPCDPSEQPILLDREFDETPKGIAAMRYVVLQYNARSRLGSKPNFYNIGAFEVEA